MIGCVLGVDADRRKRVREGFERGSRETSPQWIGFYFGTRGWAERDNVVKETGLILKRDRLFVVSL